MGAAASIEAMKPQDAGDVRATNDLDYAKSEVVRLREALGAQAKAAGIDIICLDASDIVKGENRDEDFNRCVEELAHIRTLLRLHTQQNKRRQRSYETIFTLPQLEQLDIQGASQDLANNDIINGNGAGNGAGNGDANGAGTLDDNENDSDSDSDKSD